MNTHYAGFWRRLGALLVDMIIIDLSASIVVIVMSILRHAVRHDSLHVRGYGMVVVAFLVDWLYFSLFESSSWQATPGKKALDLKVTSLSGERISFGRATGRYFAKIISKLTLYIGYLMVGFTDKKQALHDIIAGTLVVKR